MTGYTPVQDLIVDVGPVGVSAAVGAPGAVVTQQALDDLARRTAAGGYTPIGAAAGRIPGWVWVGGAALLFWWWRS